MLYALTQNSCQVDLFDLFDVALETELTKHLLREEVQYKAKR